MGVASAGKRFSNSVMINPKHRKTSLLSHKEDNLPSK